MEIDLRDAQARLAIELDGPQHLADPEAYRRGRCKDFLLQENGFLVLRFLTDDVAGQLSKVLDTITHALAGRIRQAHLGQMAKHGAGTSHPASVESGVEGA